MSGAYVAKPAESTALVPGVDIPLGWNINWTFPGPWPPGYTPDLSYNLVTGETYVPGATHAVTATLRDQVTYTTKSPDNAITWKAAIAETPVQLKFNGDSEWSNSLTSDHSTVGDYYGAEPTMLFNVTAAEDGEIITLTATSKPFNDQDTIEASAEIEVIVIGEANYAVLTLTLTGYKGQWLEEWNVPPWVGQLRWLSSQFGMTELYFGNNAGYGHAPYGTIALKHTNTHEDQPADPHWIFLHASSSTDDFEITCPAGDVRGYGCDFPRIIGDSDEGTLIITAIRIKPYAVFPWQPLTYEVKYKRSSNRVELGGKATFNLSFLLYDEDDNLVSTTTKTFTMEHIEAGDANWQEWLTLDGTSKEITVINS